VSSGQSLTAIAAGLNAALASQGMTLTASTNAAGTQLQLTSDAYGSAAGFSVSSSVAGGPTGLGGPTAGTAVAFAGTDVAGTINGVTATGTGQVLTAPTTDPTLQGLSVLVTTPGISTATGLGSITYQPGVAQQLASVADSASNATSGSITTAIQGLQSQATGLNGQIANYQQLEASQQRLLQNEFATMESTLGNLKNESASISSSLAGLPGW
jgi:flagellar hook-associated protein 2